MYEFKGVICTVDKHVKHISSFTFTIFSFLDVFLYECLFFECKSLFVKS